ncbi:hypothetical protein ScPMuIL_004444 [Solemya velum]
MDGTPTDGENWREIAEQKEKEWKNITESRIKSLEAIVAEKSKLLEEAQSKFLKIKEDFKYNLKLLQDRDQELVIYDKVFKEQQIEKSVKEVESSELKIHIDDLKLALSREEKAKAELQQHYQQRIGEKETELQIFKNTKEKELQDHRNEFESIKRKYQRQLTETQDELDTQKRELSSEFEDMLKKREQEFRTHADEMSTKVLEYELKAKLLSKELDIIKMTQEKNAMEFQEVEVGHRELEKKLKEKDWEIEDTRAMKKARIDELETALHQMETSNRRLQEDFQRKFAEMDRCVREKEQALNKVKDAYQERENVLQTSVRELQSKLEDLGVENRRLQWAHQDLEKEKNLQIEKLHRQLYELKEKWDRQLAEVSQGQVAKEIELQALQGVEEKFKLELLQKKKDIERYKKELSVSAEREAALERSKTQLELDWQRRYEELERSQYEKSEDLIKKLTRSRDDAIATTKEKARELQQRETLIRALQKDRDQAFATLKKHGIILEKNINVSHSCRIQAADTDNTSIQKQLDTLIKKLESLEAKVDNIDKRTSLSQNNVVLFKMAEYVKTLEKEVRELHKKTRELQQDKGAPVKLHPYPQNEHKEHEVMLEVKDNALVRCHIQSLNDTIGMLRAEKMELAAHAKKQQVRIQHLENLHQQSVKEPRHKQVEIDQLQYELSAQSRRSQAEIASLRQRNTDLEVQLIEARREADEYYKGGLERNMEVTALGQELSNLKIDFSQKRPPVTFGAQELVIQQLQNEILRLRQKSECLQDGMSGLADHGGRGVTTNATIGELQAKLRTAAKHIAHLAKERQQLIEIGNKLRAEKIGYQVKIWKKHAPRNEEEADMVSSSQLLFTEDPDKLGHLEKLQYKLTRQQLEYAQKFPYQSSNALTESASSEDPDSRPPSILKKSSQSRHLTGLSHDNDIPLTNHTSASEGASGAQAGDAMSARNRELLLSLSSAGGESLQEIWRMLEDGTSPVTPKTPHYPGKMTGGSNLSQSPVLPNNAELALSGSNAGLNSKPEKRPSARTRLKPKTNKLKIRNYNVKEDKGYR